MDRVYIFDTTLRDGEQSPGAAMTPAARLRIARLLEEARVDIIEAGFPAASPRVEKSVEQIAKAVKESSVAALARAHTGDIDKAWSALKHAAAPRIHTFLATSDIHLKSKLRISREAAIERATEAVAYARRYCSDVEFSAEDATRSDRALLAQILSAVVKAGATTLNVPDTVGYTQPSEIGDMIAYLMQHVEGIENARLSVHNHDDLGMAAANSLAGVRAGARQIECTINGIGERAGNCALEEVVVAMRVRSDIYQTQTAFDTSRLPELSATVARATHMPVQKNKAIVGANAFSHESGIHQDGVLKDRLTYEIIDPSSVGQQSSLPLGRNSGRHALFERAARIGLTFDDASRARFEEAFRKFADGHRAISDSDLIRLARSVRAIAGDTQVGELVSGGRKGTKSVDASAVPVVSSR